MKIDTPVTRLLGIDLPIVQAGMSWASSNAALPAAVSAAGGLGVLAAGPMRLPDLRDAIHHIRALTDRPFAVNVPLYRKGIDAVLDLLEAEKPPVIIASQGGTQKYLARFKAAGMACLHVVASVLHAQKAIAAGIDGLVVVGAEAGGHPPPSMVSTLVIVRAVARSQPGVPIIASGGFADGSGLAAALSLGAGAAQFGTRFMASDEANIHPAYREAVLDAGVEDTRLVGRDLGVIRALANDFTEAMEALEFSGAALAQRRQVFSTASLKMAAFDGDVAQGKMEAGQSAGLISDLLPAAQIVERIAREYRAALDSLPHPTD